MAERFVRLATIGSGPGNFSLGTTWGQESICNLGMEAGVLLRNGNGVDKLQHLVTKRDVTGVPQEPSIF
jgi:hypothetical protein